MAKVTIVITDGGDMVELSTSFEPELPPELTPQEVDQLTPAQLFALRLLGSLEEEEYLEELEEEEDAEPEA